MATVSFLILLFASVALGFIFVPSPCFHRRIIIDAALPEVGRRFQVQTAIATAATTSSQADAAAESSLLQAITFCNLDRDQEPQLLCDFLMEIGACATSIVDADRDTEREVPWFDERLQQEPLLVASVNNDLANQDDPWGGLSRFQQSQIGVWPRCNVTAHFPASTDLSQVMQLVQESLQISFSDTFSIERVPQRDWIVYVQQSWKPIVISKLILRFPWHTDDDVSQAVANAGEHSVDHRMVQLQLEGGIAFGTGEHPTTQLCLEYIQHLIEVDDSIHTILDYGAGSGVLGLAACAVAPSSRPVKAIGVDIDVDAVRIANVNAATNGLPMTTYLPPLLETDDSESKSLLLKAHSHLLGEVQVLPDELEGPIYDVCVANILARPLLFLAPTLASMLRPKGYLGLSGILSSQSDMVLTEYAKFFCDLRVQKELDGWVLITGLRKQQ
jgi:ribosomal protein L11 methyltransferase